MNFILLFNNIRQKFVWSFFITIIISALGIYVDFVRNNNPEMAIELIGETNILDIKEDIKELNIFYDNVDIKSRGETLSIVLFKIKNTGRASILKNYYDSTYPLRIVLTSKGNLLKAEQVSSVNKYLLSQAVPSLIDDKQIRLPEVILDTNDSYIIKTLILHPSVSSVKFDIFGKVAGIKDISLKPTDEMTTSFFRNVINGEPLVHLVRFIIYLIFLIVFLIPISFVIAYFWGLVSIHHRKIIVNKYKEHRKGNIKQSYEVMLEFYIKNDLIHLEEIKYVLSDSKSLVSYIEIIKNDIDKMESEITIKQNFWTKSKKINIAKTLKNMNLIYEDGRDLSVNKEMENELGRFIEFVRIKRG